MIKRINIIIFALAILSFCRSEKPPLLSKNLWKTVVNNLEPKDDKKMSIIDQKMNKISAYENVKAIICPKNQEAWGFLKHLGTEEIIVENDFRMLPWNEAARNAYRYVVPHNEMKPFIGCMAHCFDLSEFYFPAVQREYNELIESLIDAKVEPNDDAKSLFGSTPLLSAFMLGKKPLAHALVLLGSDVHATNNDDGRTALHYAVWYGWVEIVKLLIEAGADVNAKSNEGDTALHDTVLKNRVEIARMLIKAGADVNAKYNEGNTALHWAARLNNVKIVRILIEAGSDVNEKDNDGDTALYYAVWYNWVHVVQILIYAGTDVNEKDKDGDSALHEAAYWNCIATARILINAGAKKNVKNNNKETPLDIATQRGSKDIAALLKKDNPVHNKRKRKEKLDHHIYQEY